MRRSRALFVVFALLAASMAAGVPAAAGPPQEFTESGASVGCSFESILEPGTYLEMYADTWGGEAYLDVLIWRGSEPWETDPTIIGDIWSGSLAFGEGILEASIPLVLYETWDTVGSAEVVASYVPDGEPYTYEDRFRDGNRWVEIREVSQPLMVSGTLTIEVGDWVESFDLAGCFGQEWMTEYWMTSPSAYTARYDGFDMYCSLEDAGWFVELYGFEYDSMAEVGLTAWAPGSIPWEEEPAFYGWAGIGSLGAGSLMVSIDLWSPFSGEPVGVGELDADLTEGEVVKSEIVSMNTKEKQVQTEYVVSGSLVLPDVAFDLEGACFASEWSSKVIATSPNGPQPKGKAPVNDLPEGAIELTKTMKDHNRAAAFDPEAPCGFYDPEWGEYWEFPISRTLWYSFEGTGGMVEVSTAGSDFDTILGVYAEVDSELVQVACIDDVFDTAFSLQAAAEIMTDEDVTYYVQAGGFWDQYGLLTIAIDD